MPKCPKCHKKIDSLDAVVSETSLHNYKDGDWIRGEVIESTILRWKCPKCFQELDIPADEDSAVTFLGK
jgi:phage FluMu protein Com